MNILNMMIYRVKAGFPRNSPFPKDKASSDGVDDNEEDEGVERVFLC